MKTVRSVSAGVSVLVGLLLTACPSTGPAPIVPTGPSSATTTSVEAPAPSTSTSSAPSSSGSDVVPTPIGGKAVKSPVFSDDSCNQDAECAPVATCHSSKCVALANAGTMKAGMLCTMDCRGGTVDCGYNHCGCAEAPGGGKRCALLPGPTP